MSANRPKQTAARGGTGVGHDRDLNLSETLQPLRSRRLFQHRLRFLQVGGFESLGEPAVGRGEEVASLTVSVLLLQKLRERSCRAPFESFSPLTMGDVDGAAITGFDFVFSGTVIPTSQSTDSPSCPSLTRASMPNINNALKKIVITEKVMPAAPVVSTTFSRFCESGRVAAHVGREERRQQG